MGDDGTVTLLYRRYFTLNFFVITTTTFVKVSVSVPYFFSQNIQINVKIDPRIFFANSIDISARVFQGLLIEDA